MSGRENRIGGFAFQTGAPSLQSSGAMEIDPSELARVLRRVALAVEENTRLLSKINDLHREATELHGELGEALTDLEQLLKRVEVE
jgi:hypothetical protein